jgi:Flp pilus assembly protein TadG
MIEAAFVFPVLIFLMLGIFQIAIYISVSTSTQSAAAAASQIFASYRGGSGSAQAAANAAVSALETSTVWQVSPSDISIKMYVNGAVCASCTGSTNTTATCQSSACDTALTAAAPVISSSSSNVTSSSVSVQTNCSGISFVKSIPLTCPMTSQINGAVQ